MDKKRSVFVIGDSISIHYGPYLEEFIKNKFNYGRKSGIKKALNNLDKPLGANGGDSRQVLQYLREENDKNVSYDILLINCGLHDFRMDRDSLKKQVEKDEYRENLNKIILLGSKMANKVIWITTASFNEEVHNSRKGGVLRYTRDLEEYNAVAKEVFSEKGIDVIDLYSFVENLEGDIYCDHVHFKEEVRKLQAAFIAGSLYSLNVAKKF